MKDDSFFVGYLPFPGGLRRFYLILIPLLLVAGVGVSLLLASNQETVGGGTWQVSNTTSITGRLIMEPYPALHTEAGESVLMVVQGKQDASSATIPFSGDMVTATGFDVRRGGWHMLEIQQTGAIVAALNLYGETLAVDAMHPQFCGVLPTNSLES
jgi:hypothetical protein